MTAGAQTATRLVCHAKTADPGRRGENCGGPVGNVTGRADFVMVVDRLPEPQPGVVVAPCKNCGRWNVYAVRDEQGRRRGRAG